jgi:hypothetical protein
MVAKEPALEEAESQGLPTDLWQLRDPACVSVTKLRRMKADLTTNPLEVLAQKGGDMGWITTPKKGNKMSAHQQAGDRPHTFLIRSRDHQDAAGAQQPIKLAKSRTRILPMFNDFSRDDSVKRTLWQRDRVVQIGL